MCKFKVNVINCMDGDVIIYSSIYDAKNEYDLIDEVRKLKLLKNIYIENDDLNGFKTANYSYYDDYDYAIDNMCKNKFDVNLNEAILLECELLN